MVRTRVFFTVVILGLLGSSCQSNAIRQPDTTTAPLAQTAAESRQTSIPAKPSSSTIELPSIELPGKTGNLQNSELKEVSGISASLTFPGVLYAINDSGNAPRLYAMDEQGQSLATWVVAVRNRDWEDLARISYAGENYLVIGDTGNNLLRDRCATLHFILEPSMPAASAELSPSNSVDICFDDGPHNIEAFAIIDRRLYMLSKEPVSTAGRNPSNVYLINLPDGVPIDTNITRLMAEHIAEMPLRNIGVEGLMAAAMAGVDLTHPTSMEFDPLTDSAYILTYREVLRVKRNPNQSWADAFGKPAERVLSHRLSQAEALTVAPGRAIWFTSEKGKAPLWAIPLALPL